MYGRSVDWILDFEGVTTFITGEGVQFGGKLGVIGHLRSRSEPENCAIHTIGSNTRMRWLIMASLLFSFFSLTSRSIMHVVNTCTHLEHLFLFVLTSVALKFFAFAVSKTIRERTKNERTNTLAMSPFLYCCHHQSANKAVADQQGAPSHREESATSPSSGHPTHCATSGSTSGSPATNNKYSTRKHGRTSSSRDLKTILAVAHKEDINQSLGFSMQRSESGTFTVDDILPSSPFYPHETSLLRKSMNITSINGLSITGMDTEVAVSAIRDAPGYVLLAAEIPLTMEEPPMIRKRIVAAIHKSSPDQPLGLSLIRIPQSGSVTSHHMKKQEFQTVVSRIAPNCPFHGTDLDVGFEITRVNGLDVAKSDARAILHYIQESWGEIVVLAEMDVPAEDDESSNARDDASQSTTSTITVPGQKHHDGQEGDQQQHQYQEKQQQQQQHINHRLMSSQSTQISALRLDEEDKEQPPPTPVLFTATVVKHSPTDRLGVALNNENPLGSFVVSQISSDSLFQSTKLQVGATVMSINGVQLAGKKDMSFVSLLLQSIVGQVVLEFIVLPTMMMTTLRNEQSPPH
jgi:hypothetical protein